MELHLQDLNFKLGSEQREYIERKIENSLRHLGMLGKQEALSVQIHISQEDTKSDEDQFLCDVSVIVPKQKTIHCDVRAQSPEAAIDRATEKLNKQFEKLKTKVQD